MAPWTRFFGGAASTAAGYGVGSALGPALNPVTQAVANEMWERYPDRPLTPEEAAEALVRALMDYDEAKGEAAMNGVNEDRFRTLWGLAGEPPAPQELLALWNRGELDEARVDIGLRQSRLRPEWYPSFKALRRVLVPVSDLVRMAVREVFNPEQRAALDLDAEVPQAFLDYGARLGLSESDARNYWAAHWNLPSFTEAAQMMFRGVISEAQFTGLLKALDYAPVWRDRLEAIARPIPPLSDMIRFAVREVYDPAKVKALGLDEEFPEAFADAAALHGFAREYALQEWEAHWRLPSPEQGYRMLHRGEINLSELDGLLKALDYPKLWRDRLRNVAYLVPGRVDLRRMYAADVISRAEVKAGYKRLGYTDDDAETLTRFAVALAEKTTDAGPDSHEAKAKIQLWGTLHSAYMAGDATDAAVTEKLPQAGVAAASVAAVLATWKHEREIQRQRITPAQLKKALAKAVKNPVTGVPWTKDEVLAELLSRGWSSQDANTFLDL